MDDFADHNTRNKSDNDIYFTANQSIYGYAKKPLDEYQGNGKPPIAIPALKKREPLVR